MSADPFSDILKFTQAESLITGGFTAGGAWAIRFPTPNRIKFFAVVKGECRVHIAGEREAFLAETGDICLIVAKRSYVLASDLAVEPIDAMGLFTGIGNSATLGDGSDFRHIGGHVLLDSVSGRLLEEVLPPWIHIPAASPHATASRWLLEQLVEERTTGLPGASLASAQLAQLLFIHVLRAYLKTSSPLPASWLRALADPRIAPALHLMHSDPGHSWHLEELAKSVAMSRTMFASHFKAVAGISPLAYLTQWRMLLAERDLREGDNSVAALAHSLGYTSESAFSNAYKRHTGIAPKLYRTASRSLGSDITEDRS